jgi:hypothetical protein
LKYQQNNQGNNTKAEERWVTFACTGNYTRKITKLFKDADLMVTYKTTTTIGKLLKHTRIMNTYEQSGVYKMT